MTFPGVPNYKVLAFISMPVALIPFRGSDYHDLCHIDSNADDADPPGFVCPEASG
jgi:hypothetical protein